MKFGLANNVIEEIQKVMEANPKIDKAIIFGSRAKGNYQEGSDIDIAIKGENIKLDDLLSLEAKLDNLNLPYNIDLINYSEIREPALTEHIDRVGIEYYSRWKKYTLGEISNNISYGYTESASETPTGPKFLRITDIVPYRVNWDTVPYCLIDDKDHVKYKLEKGDIVIARTGATTGFNYVFDENIDAVFASYLIRYKIDKKKAHPIFVGYVLKSEAWKGFVEGIIGGSAQPGANAKMFAAFQINLPPLPDQKLIANVLTSLDEKIDLLYRQNKTLECMAETLFRQWFIVKAEEDWIEIELKDLALHYKENISPSERPGEMYYHYSLPAFDNGQIPVIETGKEILSNKYKVIPNSILVSKLNPRFPRIWGIFGNNIAHNSICSTEFQVVKPKESIYWTFLYYFMKSSQTIKELSSSAGGTSGSHQRVSPDDIFRLKLLLPPNEKIRNFDTIAKKQFEKVDKNINQIQELTRLRDTLLPKLLSGEARVKMP